MTCVLVVDDEDPIRQMIAKFLNRMNYTCFEASNAHTAVACLAANDNCQIVLTDLMMPGMDGLSMIEQCRSEIDRDLEFIVCTGRGDKEKAVRALRLGVGEFLDKPMSWNSVLHALTRSTGRINEKNRQRNLLLRAEEFGLELSKAKERLETADYSTACRIASIARIRDHETAEHCERVGRYSRLIAELMGKTAQYAKDIEIAAILHDVGKIGMPDSILMKTGDFTDEERREMQRHTILGSEILLEHRDNRILDMAARIALGHHESFDGSGYPYGLAGHEICLEARICSLADVYDALRSKRRYKAKMEHGEAVTIICEGDGRTRPEHFDPAVLNVFKANHERFDAIYQGLPDNI